MLFHKYPNRDPKTNEPIMINSDKYNKLVSKYGQPKIKSPITNYKIAVGKGEYNKLIAKGYTENNLLKKEKIKSPVTNKLISTEGKTYKELVKKGYFVSFTGNKEVDTEILLNLEMKDLNIINQWTNDILNSKHFWCQWISLHMNIDTNKDCQFIAKKLNNNKDLIENYKLALENGYYTVVEFLLQNKLVNPDFITKNDWFPQLPIYIAAQHGHIEIIKLLLSYPEVKHNLYMSKVNDLYMALDIAAKNNHVEIVQYLLNEIQYSSEDLTDLLPDIARLGNRIIIDLLINAGAMITKTTLLQAIYSGNIDLVKYLLTFIKTISLELIQNTLGLKKYEILKLLLKDERTIIPVKEEALILLDNHAYDELDKLLIPYLPELEVFYEIRYKWIYKF